MTVSTLVRAASQAVAQGRPIQASRLLVGAANRTPEGRQRFAILERAYELAQ